MPRWRHGESRFGSRSARRWCSPVGATEGDGSKPGPGCISRDNPTLMMT